MNEIHVHNVPSKTYNVQIVYAGFDSHDDKPNWEEPDIWNIIIDASCSETAISDAMKIVNIERAIIMTDFMTAHHEVMKQDSYTYEDIEKVRDKCQETNVFKSWMLIEPTSIQVCLSDDLDTLQSMTAESVVHNMENVGNEVEDFLKKGTTNDDA